MLSRKDLNSVELETVRVSRNPSTVITANEEVQNQRGSNNKRERSWFIRGSTKFATHIHFDNHFECTYMHFLHRTQHIQS